MGLIQKKDQKEEIDGIQIIERSDTPDDLPENPVDLVAGTSAEHLAKGTTAEEEAAAAEEKMRADADDDALKEDIDEEEAMAELEDEGKKKKIFVAAAVAAVVIAAILGFFIGSGAFGGKGTGTSKLTEDQLNDTVATYAYNGAKHSISAREAIESQYSVESVKDENGKYAAPSADAILSYARNQILLDEAEKEGVKVSAKDMKEYAKKSIGTDDYGTMAKQYNVSKGQAKTIVKQSVMMQKLYEKVVPSASSSSTPEQPSEPKDKNNLTDDEKKAYADYIIKLAGKDWDSSKNAWRDSNSDYAKQLPNFDGQSASFNDAKNAYYVAYQAYSTQASSASSKWTEFSNKLFANADIQIYGLYA